MSILDRADQWLARKQEELNMAALASAGRKVSYEPDDEEVLEKAIALPSGDRGGRAKFYGAMMLRHPVRMRRLETEMDWLRREARRFGIDPEEIRWLI